MLESVGCIIKNVKNSAKPIITLFGGADCVLSAALVKCRTMIILVNEVNITINDGAIAINVRISRIRNAPFNVPLPSLYVTVTVFAIFNSCRSSADSDAPGSSILVRSTVSPVKLESTWESPLSAYTISFSWINIVINNMPARNSRHNILFTLYPEKYFFILIAYSLLFRSSSFSRIVFFCIFSNNSLKLICSLFALLENVN